MKKVLFFIAFSFAVSAPSFAQTIIKSNVPEGADPAALPIQFLPADALVLPNGDVQMGVAVKATAKNIGTLPYLPGATPLKVKLYLKSGNGWTEVDSKSVNVLAPGVETSMNYYTTYLKGKQKPPTFKLVVESKNAGVVNPDVNMNNNKKEAQAQ
jgi:hypothetical protein